MSKYEKQINAMASLSWNLKRQIDEMEGLLKDTAISTFYRAYLNDQVSNLKQEMIINADAAEILMREG